MGCHVWALRPITEKEFQMMKEYAPTSAHKLCGNDRVLVKLGMVDQDLERKIIESVNTDTPCVDGHYWWELGWGSTNPELSKAVNGFYTHVVGKKLYVGANEYNDLARIVYTYPRKVIHNRHELRKYYRKKYFQVPQEELEKLSEFWHNYPNGILTFG